MKKIKLYFKYIFLKILTKLFRKSKSDRLISLNSTSKILILTPGNKSEALLTTPLIHLISRNTNAKIYILSNENNYEVFNNNADIEKNIICEKTFRKIIYQTIIINKSGFDVFVNTTESNNINDILYTALIKANYKIGYKNIDDNIFTHLIEKQNPLATHFVDRKLQLCRFFNFPIDKSDLNLYYKTSANSEEEIDKFLMSVFDSSKMLVLINISSDINMNYWRTDNFKRLIKYIKNYDVNIILTSNEKDILNADNISSGKEKIYISDEFDKTATLVSRSNFIFTTNSFVLQLSAVYKKPVFCLFANENKNELLRVPYTSDFDFISSEKNDYSDLHFGKVLNSFIPYFDYVYESFKRN